MGEIMNVGPTNSETFMNRMFFDMSFFLLINIIFLNVIFGIIVDTFSQLRHEAEERESDTNDVCFVCGLTRSDFSKGGRNFEKHKNKEHDPWIYVAYLYYLEEKGEDELSGLEQACYDNFLKLKTEWIPMGNTVYLGFFFLVKNFRG